MGLIVNEGNFGLNTLAGLSVSLLEGQQLPADLYVYGLEDRGDYSFYLDENLPNARAIQAALTNIIEVPTRVGLPSAPRHNPALGIVRSMRTDANIGLATRVAVFVLFALNNRIRVEQMDNAAANPVPRRRRTPWQGPALVGDYIILPNLPGAQIIEGLIEGGETLLINGNVVQKNASFPAVPEVGNRARLLGPFTVGGLRLAVGDAGTVMAIDNTSAVIQLDNNAIMVNIPRNLLIRTSTPQPRRP